jgi:hypothetical protein
MQKILLLFVAFLCIASSSFGQKYFTKTASVHFTSDAPMEKIEASNNNGYVVLDAASGQLEWSVLIKGFKFDKALMQEHFNENYMESSRFPKAVFKGNLVNPQEINCTKDGSYDVHVNGNITIHGVTKPLQSHGRMIIKNGVVSVSGSFDLTVADFDITVPKIVRDNIAKTVLVNVHGDLIALKQ